jgi:succinate dehydrogenase/fumarate reductase flavoprotein subunit
MSCPTITARCTPANGASIVLMARIVRGDGNALRRSEVAAIAISTCELEPWQLPVAEVFMPVLTRDDLWTIDDVGYNFRHEVAPGRGFATPQILRHIELQYVFRLADNSRTAMRFNLKLVSQAPSIRIEY